MSGGQKNITTPSLFKWKGRGQSSLTTGLLNDVTTEIELSDYRRLPSSGSESPSGLLNGEGLKAAPIADLDLFFERVYNYHCEKGLWCIVIKWIVELLSLGFTICFSGFFLLFVDWHGLQNMKCGINAVESRTKPCDLIKEALHRHPLVPFTFTKAIILGYLGIFTIYWLFCFLRFFAQLKDTLEIRKFYCNSLSVTDREVQTTPWPEILEKVVQLQQSEQLCVVKDLSAHDVVMRIMRKENYLIGMLNKGVLAFPISWWVPGAGPPVTSKESGRKNHLILTKTLEWTLNWCILQSMFDKNFSIRRDFITNPSTLRKRLMTVGIGMLLISPFLVIFMLVYLFLRHAEQFYNHPSTASSRRWSNLSRWIFRELNEVEHLFKNRINNSVVHASDYLKQFPSPIVSLIAKFISFVSGGFAAILIIIAFLEESLLEGQIYGRNLFWYAAVFGAVTAISRAAVTDEFQVFDPEGAMSLVVQHTHYLPKRWRGKENTDSIRTEFETLFQYTGMMLLEEMGSIFLTPYLLLFVVPKRVDDILQFISDFTVDVEGVGHVCSFSVFDFETHGNSRYGSPYNAPRDRRSSQGKMEKSFLSFQNAYPTWDPNTQGRHFLSTLRNFREEQMRQETPHTYLTTQNRRLTPDFRGRGETVHRFPSKYMPNNLMGVPRAGYNLGSLWLINHDQRTHPYLLDCYYMSRPLYGVDHSKDAEALPSETTLEGTGQPFPPYEIPQTEANPEENWSSPHLDRLRSHLEASTSSSFFRDSLHRHVDIEKQREAGDTHWWARPGPETSGGPTSFLEPPMSFGHYNFGHHGDDIDRSYRTGEEDQEGSSGGMDMKNSAILSQTTYLDECENDDRFFNLPFNDIYGGPLKSLPLNWNKLGTKPEQ